MVAILTNERFSDPDWIFERKLDGVRCLAFRKGSRIELLSRNRASKNTIYPELLKTITRRLARKGDRWKDIARRARAMHDAEQKLDALERTASRET
jgi:ATP dependent DNA ligase domain